MASDAPSVAAIRTLLAEAYQADPLVQWLLPDASTRVEACAAWLGLFVERYRDTGTIDHLTGHDLDAVALWRLPGGPDTKPLGTLPTIRGLLGAIAGAEWAGRATEGLATLRTLAPSEPHAYLQFLAVAPSMQRRGLGHTLLEIGVQRASRLGLPVHLETTNPGAVAFYEAMGFTVTGALTLPGGGPHAIALGLHP